MKNKRRRALKTWRREVMRKKVEEEIRTMQRRR
jgi:hypothetical protein